MNDELGNDGKGKCKLCPVAPEIPKTKAAEMSKSSDHLVSAFNLPRKHKHFASGDSIFCEGDDFDGVYCLNNGLVALRKFDVNGAGAVIRVVKPGEMFGHRAFIMGQTHSTTAEALCPLSVCFTPKSTLKRFVADQPEAMQVLVQNMGKNMQGVEHLFMLTVTKSVRSRFAHFLLGLASRHEQVVDGKSQVIEIKLPISKKEVAGILGIAVESLSRIISHFDKTGIIKTNQRAITILDRDALIKMVD